MSHLKEQLEARILVKKLSKLVINFCRDNDLKVYFLKTC